MTETKQDNTQGWGCIIGIVGILLIVALGPIGFLVAGVGALIVMVSD